MCCAKILYCMPLDNTLFCTENDCELQDMGRGLGSLSKEKERQSCEIFLCDEAEWSVSLISQENGDVLS